MIRDPAGHLHSDQLNGVDHTSPLDMVRSLVSVTLEYSVLHAKS